MSPSRRSPAVLLVLALAVACSSNGETGDGGATVCEPQTTRSCACPGGPDGVQTCNDDGSGWNACQCPNPHDGGSADGVVSDGAQQPDLASQTDIDLATDPLPEGNTGIAAKHKGDVGIASDPAVIFADDFEGYASAAGLTSNWDVVHHSAHVSIVTDAAANRSTPP